MEYLCIVFVGPNFSKFFGNVLNCLFVISDTNDLMDRKLVQLYKKGRIQP